MFNYCLELIHFKDLVFILYDNKYMKTIHGLNYVDNIIGGTDGQIVYQTAPDTTSFLSPPYLQLAQYLNGQAPNIRKFTSSTTYTPTTNIVLILVEIIGGGGGGSGYNADLNICGGGGGGGSYIKVYLAPSNYSITIGSGGAGGSGGSNPVVGSAGAATSFSTYTAPGGLGASTINDSGQGGVAPTGSYISSNGHKGFIGTNLYAGYGGGNFIYPNHGPFINGAAIPANTLYGVGGSGGNSTSGGTGQSGRPGIVIVTEFY